jgi:hypothetical protein
MSKDNDDTSGFPAAGKDVEIEWKATPAEEFWEEMSKEKPTKREWAENAEIGAMCLSGTNRALLALLDMEDSVKETALGQALGALQAQITELQERVDGLEADIQGMMDGPWDPPPPIQRCGRKGEP